MQLATRPSLSSSINLSGVACACLLSLIISCSDTGKLLSALSALIMSSDAIASQNIQVRYILVNQVGCVKKI